MKITLRLVAIHLWKKDQEPEIVFEVIPEDHAEGDGVYRKWKWFVRVALAFAPIDLEKNYDRKSSRFDNAEGVFRELVIQSAQWVAS